MNIFVLDTDPERCAKYHCDRHVVSQIKESLQLLSNVWHSGWEPTPEEVKPWITEPTHLNHPCSKWVVESICNYLWTKNLLGYLLEEYRFRYGKEHTYQTNHDMLCYVPALSNFETTPFVQAMPDPYKQESAVCAYRAYYIGEKKRFARWDYTKTPDWWTN